MEEMIEKKFEATILLSWYGPLLTDTQAHVMDLYLNEDLTLAEIAEQSGVSRQGVYDMLNRAGKQLTQYESKLGLARRADERLKKLDRCLKLAEKIVSDDADEAAKELKEELRRMIDEEERT